MKVVLRILKVEVLKAFEGSKANFESVFKCGYYNYNIHVVLCDWFYDCLTITQWAVTRPSYKQNNLLFLLNRSRYTKPRRPNRQRTVSSNEENANISEIQLNSTNQY